MRSSSSRRSRRPAPSRPSCRCFFTVPVSGAQDLCDLGHRSVFQVAERDDLRLSSGKGPDGRPELRVFGGELGHRDGGLRAPREPAPVLRRSGAGTSTSTCSRRPGAPRGRSVRSLPTRSQSRCAARKASWARSSDRGPAARRARRRAQRPRELARVELLERLRGAHGGGSALAQHRVAPLRIGPGHRRSNRSVARGGAEVQSDRSTTAERHRRGP